TAPISAIRTATRSAPSRPIPTLPADLNRARSSGRARQSREEMQSEPTYILTFRADDRVGIVAAVSSFLADRGGFILDSQQFAALSTGRFYMRVLFTGGGPRFPQDADALREEFRPIAE